MSEAQEIDSAEIVVCKRLTVALLTEPMAEWCDDVKARNLSPEFAYTSLVLYFATILAGVAEELGVSPSPKVVGELVVETLEKEMAA